MHDESCASHPRPLVILWVFSGTLSGGMRRIRGSLVTDAETPRGCRKFQLSVRPSEAGEIRERSGEAGLKAAGEFWPALE